MEQKDDWHLTDLVEHAQGRADPFAAAVRATRMPMCITDPAKADNPIVFANEAFQKLTGFDRSEIIGRNCRFLQGPETDPASVRAIRDAIESGEPINVDLLNYRKDGSRFWNALYLSPVRDDAGRIVYYFSSQLDVTDRVAAQAALSQQKAIVEAEVRRRTAELEAALESKTVLLHEIDHRVKNNLTMIGALLRMQARSIGDPALSAKLNDMLERIDALATVHRTLYQSEDLRYFDVGKFVEILLSDVVGASGRTDIALVIDCDTVQIPARHATAVGLILNEILTNAIKHAFAEGRSGSLRLTTRRADGLAVVEVQDDGPGFKQGSSAAASGLGRTLTSRLSKQVGAEVRTVSTVSGTTVTISIPMSEGKP